MQIHLTKLMNIESNILVISIFFKTKVESILYKSSVSAKGHYSERQWLHRFSRKKRTNHRFSMPFTNKLPGLWNGKSVPDYSLHYKLSVSAIKTCPARGSPWFNFPDPLAISHRWLFRVFRPTIGAKLKIVRFRQVRCRFRLIRTCWTRFW